MTGRFALLLASTLAALGIAEVAARVLVPDPYLAFENRIELFIEDEHAGYRNRPNYHGYAQGTIRVRTNSLGFRGDDTATGRSDGRVRIAAVGDSVTWGVGVQEDATFAHLLHKHPGGAAAAPGRVEVINAGVIGYSLHQELLLLEHRVMPLQPDIVLVAFTLNDAYPTEDPFFNVHTFHRPRREGVRRRHYAAMPEPASYLYRWTRSIARQLKEQGELAQLDAAASPALVWADGSFEAGAWPVQQQHFRRMAELAGTHDAKMVVAIFPTKQQIEAASGAPAPQGMMREFFAAAKIAHIDLFDTLRDRYREAFMDNMHLTPEGHRLVADRLRTELAARRWLEN